MDHLGDDPLSNPHVETAYNTLALTILDSSVSAGPVKTAICGHIFPMGASDVRQAFNLRKEHHELSIATRLASTPLSSRPKPNL